MVKSQNQNVHIWNPIVATFLIFTSRYVLVSSSVLKTHTGLENNLFQYVFDSLSPWKKVDNVKTNNFCGCNYWVWLEAIWDFDTFTEEQATCN